MGVGRRRIILRVQVGPYSDGLALRIEQSQPDFLFFDALVEERSSGRSGFRPAPAGSAGRTRGAGRELLGQGLDAGEILPSQPNGVCRESGWVGMVPAHLDCESAGVSLRGEIDQPLAQIGTDHRLTIDWRQQAVEFPRFEGL